MDHYEAGSNNLIGGVNFVRVSCPTVNGYDQPEHRNDKVEQTGMNGNHQQKSEVLPRNIRTMLTYVDLLIKDLNDNSSSCDRVMHLPSEIEKTLALSGC